MSLNNKETIAQFLERCRTVARLRHLAYSTEQSYVATIRRFICFHGRKHPDALGAEDIRAYLSFLAVEGNVTASTQNAAFAALLFLYRDVLKVTLPQIENVERANRARRLPTVFSRAEVKAILMAMEGTPWRVCSLLYGTGMRLTEALRLRVKDVDFEGGEIVVREAKGDKDRRTMLPRSLVEPLQAQVVLSRAFWERDRSAEAAGVEVPHALERKYRKIGQTWGWHWIFPMDRLSVDPRSRIVRRHHIMEDVPRAWSNTDPATRFGTRSRPTCSKTATISARYRSCWATKMSRRRWPARQGLSTPQTKED